MIILHDSNGSDLSHIQAIADIEEGFSLYDYVRIKQSDGRFWIGQIVQPNLNISIVGDRLDPTILHGLKLMQQHSNVQSVESVQVFDILILGAEIDGQMQTPRVRPLPGAHVDRLNADETCRVIAIPGIFRHRDQTTNVIGELLNADQVPLCINVEKFNFHIMIAGGTGSGKSNAAANVIDQALKYGKCVLLHDAKPDYKLIRQANTDKAVSHVWDRFKNFGLKPRGYSNVIRIGFSGLCDENSVDHVVGFRASDFRPELLAGLLFSETNEEKQFESFASAADSLYQRLGSPENRLESYPLENILNLVQQRMSSNDPREQIHSDVGRAILRKARQRSTYLPWLDTVGKEIGGQKKVAFKSSRLDGVQRQVQRCDLMNYIDSGRLILIDYSGMDNQSYAVILSYFLRESQAIRKKRQKAGLVQMVDEAHRIFDNDSRHSARLARNFERVMREGRSVDHSIILSLQNASQIPHRVMNNLNTKIVMRQNSKEEADAATQTMGKEFASQSMRLGTGQALVSLHESRAVVLAQMAPSPYELMRNDNTGENAEYQAPMTEENIEDDPFNQEFNNDDIPF